VGYAFYSPDVSIVTTLVYQMAPLVSERPRLLRQTYLLSCQCVRVTYQEFFQGGEVLEQITNRTITRVINLFSSECDHSTREDEVGRLVQRPRGEDGQLLARYLLRVPGVQLPIVVRYSVHGCSGQ